MIILRLDPPASEVAGTRLEIRFQEEIKVSELLSILVEMYPALRQYLRNETGDEAAGIPHFMRGDVRLELDDRVCNTDEVTLCFVQSRERA